MASKFAWLISKRTVIFTIAAVVAVVLGQVGHSVHLDGLWDGPG